METRRHLGTDIGRNDAKIAGAENYTDRFSSAIGPAHNLRLANTLRPTDIILQMEGGSYFVGSMAEQSHGSARMMTASKIHNDTKLLMAAAIARATNDGDDWEVTMGVPVADRKAITKQQLSELLVGDYDVQLNGRRLRFRISELNIVVEGPAAYALLCPAEAGTLRFLDLGSRTVNFGTVVNGRYLDPESDTLDYGCDTVNTGPEYLARKVAADLSRYWRDFQPTTYVFGGGAIQTFDLLKQYISNAVAVENPQMVNAKTFYAIGEAIRRGKTVAK